MARVSRSAIEDRLARMVREIDAIEATVPATLEEYLAPENETLRVALEHRIFMAVQAMVDIAAHIVASQGHGAPATSRDAIVELAQLGVVPAEIVDSVADAVGLRNAIAHAYLALDATRVYASLHKTRALKQFAAAVWEWLEQERGACD